MYIYVYTTRDFNQSTLVCPCESLCIDVLSATLCSTLQHPATHYNPQQLLVGRVSFCMDAHTATYCKHTATHCNPLQLYVLMCFSLPGYSHCNTLQHTATHFNPL